LIPIEIAAAPTHLSSPHGIAVATSLFMPTWHSCLPASSGKEESSHPLPSSLKAATKMPGSLLSMTSAKVAAEGCQPGLRSLLGGILPA
jgi:hypothetical protein